MNDLPKRKRLRLREFDYSQNNYYFVTICTFEKQHFFGMTGNLTECGKIAEDCICRIPEIFSCVKPDKYVVMPNHIHAVLAFEKPLTDSVKHTARIYACPTPGTVIGNYKAAVTRNIHQKFPGLKLWQTGFYDHIIRNQSDYENIWTYIDENPAKWESDDYY
ncbi:MAG: transposase [Clostridia bacterium]|nr:transposase [Clostridia bacterium]